MEIYFFCAKKTENGIVNNTNIGEAFVKFKCGENLKDDHFTLPYAKSDFFRLPIHSS